MKDKEWVRSERRRLHRSERRLQILSESGSKETDNIDVFLPIDYYFFCNAISYFKSFFTEALSCF